MQLFGKFCSEFKKVYYSGPLSKKYLPNFKYILYNYYLSISILMYFFNNFPFLLGPKKLKFIYIVFLYTVFPYHSIVLTTEGGCVTESHGLGSNGGIHNHF